jgi:GntR family transcriptional regulator, transcriptional repressor for pyruvate dehydrogenase complex
VEAAGLARQVLKESQMLARSNSSRSATARTVRFIREAIETGRLAPGDRLPSERELALQVGVSRPSVRAALQSLATLGIVHIRHGSGSYVADGLASFAREPVNLLASLHRLTPAQLLETRRTLEERAVELAAEQATPEQIASIADEVSAMFASTDDVQAFREHDQRFHQMLAQASGNPLLAVLADMVSSAYFDRRRRVGREVELHEVAGRHHSIYLAVRAHDSARARREMGQHLATPLPGPELAGQSASAL